jgi:hypothetical protein
MSTKTIKEHIERIKYVSKYRINETPKYKNLIGDSNIDMLPEYLMKEEGEENPENSNNPLPDPNAAPDPNAVGGAPAGGSPAPETPAPAPTPQPIPSNTNVDITTAPSTQPAPEIGGIDGMNGGSVQSTEKRVMELQIDALRKMSQKIEDLGSTVDNLNQRLEMYSTEVDKVREPSDMEKFNERKLDSSPYYFNLNDLWKGDDFKSRMDQFSKGYVKTEDGYIADFDDLNKLSPHEVKASFDL